MRTDRSALTRLEKLQRKKRLQVQAYAVKLASGRSEGIRIEVLVQRLVRKHQIPSDIARALIEQTPELIRTGFMVRRRPTLVARAESKRARRESHGWERVVEDLTLYLKDPGTDAVHMRVTASDTPSTTLLGTRLDFVETQSLSEIWFAALVNGRVLLERLVSSSTRTLGPGWTLPLVPIDDRVSLPVVVVWRFKSPQEAVVGVRTTLETTLGVEAARIRHDRDECSPGELERRVTGRNTIRRLHDRTGPNRLPMRTCDRCGMPLSDPTSVRIGIGPECLKYYSRHVLHAVGNPKAPVRRPGTKRPKSWLRAITETWQPPEQ